MNKSGAATVFYVVLFSFFISQVIFCPAASSENLPTPNINSENILFAIGTVDQSMSDFTGTGFGKIEKYECNVGVDCSTETFPLQMYKTSTSSKDRTVGALSIKINFNLSQSYEKLFLRLARAGAETTIVTLDDDKEFIVTGTMLGSDEKRKYGSYDLALGSLGQGSHSIHLIVDEDSPGNGLFWWDALILFFLSD